MSHRIPSRLSFLDRFRRILSVERSTVAVSRRHARSLEVLESRIAPAAALGATKVAVFAPGGDVNGDGKFQPGDTILYTVTITNNGDVDLTGVTFNDIIDPNTNLGAVNVSPLALNDTFTAVANTLLEVGVTHGSSPAAQVAGSVVGNDVEFLGDTFTLSKLQAVSFSGGTASATSGQGGSVTMNASGNFSYLPAAGFTGTDTFSYTITDKGLDGVAGNADDLTSDGTVTITVGTQKVWYVDNSYTGVNGASDGRSTRPFTSITATNLNGPGGVGDVDGANDIIFLHTGTGATYTVGIGLEAGQTLQGQGTALIVGGFNLVGAGTLPKLSNAGGVAVNLSTDNKLLGFSANDAATSISGTSFNTLDVHNVTIANTTGAGLSLTTGSFVSGAQFNSISSAGGVHGIALTGVNGTGAGVDLGGNSGTGLTGATGGAFFVSGGNAPLSFGGPITNTAGHSVDISTHATGNITISTATLNDTGTGISITNNTSGTIFFTGTAKVLHTTVNTAVTFTGNGANLTFIGNGLVDIVTTTGMGINATGNTGALSITNSGNSITTTTGTALNVVNTPIGASGLTFQSISKNGGTNNAINLDSTGAGFLTVTGTGTTAASGGTLQNISGADAIHLNNTGGLITLKNMVIQDITSPGDAGAVNDTRSNVDAIQGTQVLGGLTIDRTTIQRISDNGINGSVDGGQNPTATVWNGLTITNSTIQDTNRFNVAGHADAQVEGAVFMLGLKGTVVVTGDTIQRAGSGLDINTDTSGVLDMTVQGNTFTTLYKETGGTASVGNWGINVVQLGSLVSTIRIGDTATESNTALGNTFTDAGRLAGIRIIGENTSTGALKVSVAKNTFTVTDHSSPGVAAGGQLYNFPQGGTLFRARGTGNFEGIFAANTLDQVMHADGGLGQFSIIAEGGDTEVIARNNNFKLPWDAPVELRADGASGTQASAKVLFNNNTYTSGTVGDGTTDLGGPSPYEGFFVAVRNAGKLDLTMQNETLGLNDPSSAINLSFYTQTTAHANTFNLFLQNIQSPRGFRISETSPTAFNLYKGVSSSSVVQTVLQDNGDRGGAGVATTNPPAVTVTGTITISNTAPALPSITAPLFFAPSAGDVTVAPTQTGTTSTGTTTTTTTTGAGSTAPVIVDDGVLSQAELDSLVGAAKARWAATGLSEAQLATLDHVTFSVADLPGWYLGEASPGHVTLDLNAAGNSWFIDPTPNDDSEFAGSHATATGGAAGRIDALTTVMHELGHQLGLDDSYVSSDSGNLMYGFIHQSERRLPSAHQADGATPHLVQGDLDFAVGPINIGSLPIGKSVQVVFTAQINANPSASTISNQGTASSTQTGPVLTDDPNVAGTTNPTVTQIALPEVNLSIGTTTSVAEDSGGNLVYTFTRQAPLTNPLTVNFNVSGGAVFTGNAASDTDYTQSGAASFTGTTGTVTFAANSNTATVTVTPHADTLTEPDETVVLTVASGTGYSVASTGSISGTGTIVNDDTTVFVTGTPGSVAEDSGSPLTYTFKRNGVISNALDVHLHLAGSATFPTDYTQSGASSYDGTDAFLHFNAGSDTAVITLTPVIDSTVEPDETVQMTIVSGAGYNVDAVNNSLTGTITNDDATVSVAIQAPGSIAEDAPGVLTYTFTRTGFIANAATVNFTASGSATKDVDYGVNGASFIGLAGTVTFAPNSTTAIVTVDPTADANGEPDETVIFTINAGAGYSPDVSPNEHATGTILNDDTSVSVAVTGSPISEAATGGAHLTYTFTRSGDNSTPLTINFSAGGSASFANDYVLTGPNSFSTASGLGTLTFPANTSTATVSLIPTNDTLVEGDEQAALFVNTGPGYGVGASPAIGTITDNETATISFVASASNAPEQTTPHPVDVKLITFSPEGTASLQNDFVVYVQDHGGSGAAPATGGGVDYSFNEQSLTFTAGDTGSTKTVNVAIVNDTISEGNEMFQLGLSATPGAPPPFAGSPTSAVTVDTTPHTITIIDNDVDVHVTANGSGGSVIAGSGAGNFSVVFSVQNTGLTDATNLNLSELFTLPAGVTFAGAVGGAGDTITLTDTGGTWTIPALAKTGADTLTVNFTADHSTAGGASASVSSTASSADQVLVNTGDDSASASGSFARQSDLHLTKTDSPDPVGPGGQLTYTITVHNNGPSDATLASVTDLLPSASYSNATWTTTLNGAPGAGGSGDVNASSAIPAQGDFVVTVVGTVIAASNTSFMNTASVNSSEETNFMDNSDMATTFVGGVDLTLHKTADLATQHPGDVIRYTLSYHNGGFITANGVNINDIIPANTTFDLADSTAGWQDSGGNPLADGAAAGSAVKFPVGSVPVSMTDSSIILAVKVKPAVSAGANTIDNTATIADDGNSGADITPGDNTSSAQTTLVAAPDLHVTQMADKLLIIRGQTLHVSYTYSNDGNQDASGATIVAHVPTGTTFDAGQSSGGWSDSGMGNFTLDLGTVGAASSGTVIFAVDLNTTRVAGLHEVDTTATIDDDHNNGPDPTMANNTAASTATKIYEGIYAVSQGIAVPGKAGIPTVRVFDPIDGHELYHFNAYELSYRASVRVAVADINGDGFDDVITTSNLGTGRLRVFDGLTGQWLHDEASYTGPFKNEIAVFNGKTDKGAFVAAGDLTGDGRADIVVGSALGGSKVRILDGFNGVAQTFGPANADFFQPFGKTFKGGVRVAVGDVLGSNRADLAVAMGFYGSEVKVYDGNQFGGLKFLAAALPPPPGPVSTIDFKVGPASYKGGLSIALGDLDGDGKLDLITGRNFYKPTLVETFSGLLKDGNGNPQMLGAAIDPFDKNPAKPTYALGVRVAAIDVDFDGVADIIAASGGNNKSTVNIYSGADHHLIRTFTAIPQTPNSALFTAGTAVSPVVRFA